MAYGQGPSGSSGGESQGKTSIADYLGETSNANIGTPDVDPNSFQYGGQAGGAAAAQAHLQGLGAQGINYSGTNQYQGAANTALGQMQQQALGNDGGVAEGQLKQGAADAQAAQMSGAAGARGGGANLAAAQSQAMNNGAGLAANADFQAAQMRNQNQQAAIGQSANLAQGLLGQQAGMAQANAQLQQGYEGQANQVGEAQLNAQGNQQQLQSQNQLQQQQQAIQQGGQNAQANTGLVNSVIGGVGGAIGSIFSDENVKTNVLGQSDQKGGGGDMFDSRTYTQSGGNAAGEAALQQRDAHTANFKQMGTAMGDWVNKSNAQPWSAESNAADQNLNKEFFNGSGQAGMGAQAQPNARHMMLSDEDAKTAPTAESDEGKENAAISKDAGMITNGFTKGAGQPARIPEAAPYHPQHLSIQRHEYKAVDLHPDLRSDERSKKSSLAMAHSDQQEFDSPKNAAQDFSKSIKPYTYDYKDKHVNDGERRLGFMAQDIEKSSTGPDLVKDTPAGKVVDVKALSSANTASIGDHESRLSQLEKHLKSLHSDSKPGIDPSDTSLVSDTKAKKDAILEEGRKQGAEGASGDSSLFEGQDGKTFRATRRKPTDDFYTRDQATPDKERETTNHWWSHKPTYDEIVKHAEADHQQDLSMDEKGLKYEAAKQQARSEPRLYGTASDIAHNQTQQEIAGRKQELQGLPETPVQTMATSPRTEAAGVEPAHASREVDYSAPLEDQAAALKSKVDDGTWMDEKEPEKKWKPRVVHPAMAMADDVPEGDSGGDASLPAGSPNLDPHLAAPQDPGVIEATTGQRIGDTPPELRSDSAAKKNAIREEAFNAGFQAGGGKDENLVGVHKLSVPGYTTPAVQSPDQHEKIMHAIDFKESHPEIDTSELQRHIDMIMKQGAPPPAPVGGPDPRRAADAPIYGLDDQAPVAGKAPRGYAPRQDETEHAGPLEGEGRNGMRVLNGDQAATGLAGAYADEGEEAHEPPPKREPRGYAERPKTMRRGLQAVVER